MPSLQVRDLPDPLYNKLKISAARSHRSLAGEAVFLLETALECCPSATGRRREILSRIGERAAAVPANLPDPVGLVREDRER